MLGVGAAFLRDYLDDTIKGKEDLIGPTSTSPVIGLIPAVDGWKDSRKNEVVALSNPAAPVAEAYRSSAHGYPVHGYRPRLHIVQVTSPAWPKARPRRLPTLQRYSQRQASASWSSTATCGGRAYMITSGSATRSALPRCSSAIRRCKMRSCTWAATSPVRAAVGSASAQPFRTPLDQADDAALRRGAGPVRHLPNRFASGLPVTDPVVIAKSADAVVLVAAAGVTTRKAAPPRGRTASTGRRPARGHRA